jgi:hypothetical protein
MKKTLITIVVFMMLTSLAPAFNITLSNDRDELMYYNVIWLACDWEGFPSSHSMALGEIQPGMINDLGIDYVPGPYLIEWSGSDFRVGYEIQINSKKGVLMSSPNQTPLFIPGI